MQAGDIGCHVTAMCAQAIEKSLKGYVLLNNQEYSRDHRPDADRVVSTYDVPHLWAG